MALVCAAAWQPFCISPGPVGKARATNRPSSRGPAPSAPMSCASTSLARPRPAASAANSPAIYLPGKCGPGHRPRRTTHFAAAAAVGRACAACTWWPRAASSERWPRRCVRTSRPRARSCSWQRWHTEGTMSGTAPAATARRRRRAPVCMCIPWHSGVSYNTPTDMPITAGLSFLKPAIKTHSTTKIYHGSQPLANIHIIAEADN